MHSDWSMLLAYVADYLAVILPLESLSSSKNSIVRRYLEIIEDRCCEREALYSIFESLELILGAANHHEYTLKMYGGGPQKINIEININAAAARCLSPLSLSHRAPQAKITSTMFAWAVTVVRSRLTVSIMPTFILFTLSAPTGAAFPLYYEHKGQELGAAPTGESA
jgi:hypothetical protein